MTKHKCKESDYCTCSIAGLEPDEECPVHGAGVWPPQCGICGRFMPWSERAIYAQHLEELKELEDKP